MKPKKLLTLALLFTIHTLPLSRYSITSVFISSEYFENTPLLHLESSSLQSCSMPLREHNIMFSENSSCSRSTLAISFTYGVLQASFFPLPPFSRIFLMSLVLHSTVMFLVLSSSQYARLRIPFASFILPASRSNHCVQFRTPTTKAQNQVL